MPSRCLLVPGLLALACLAPAAELGWSGAPGARPPSGWTVSAAAEAGISFGERAIEISALPGRQALAVAAVDLPDGSDDRPLRLSALVSASGRAPLDGYPALVALEWGGGAVFAVGLGSDPHTKGDERRAWAVWSGNGVAGTDHAEVALADGASPAHLRLVLTSHEVAAYGSRDGVIWSRVAGLPRDRLGATGAPARVVVGRGQARSGAAGLAADPPGSLNGSPRRYRFAEVRIEDGPAEVPSAALRTYAKKDSLADTLDAFAAAGVPRRWRLRGPDDARTTAIPVELPADFTTGDAWKEHLLPEQERFLQLGALLPAAGQRLRWAATDIDVGETGWVRFSFDGMPQCWLWVDGRLVMSAESATREAESDRLSASVWLPAGVHQVVLATRAGDGRTAATLRWEPGDPRRRIALLRRLAVDFAGDEQLADAPFEIARLWEGLGFARQAVAALVEAVAGEQESAERALIERARLLHHLGDAAAASAETAALQKLWEAAAVDPLTAARRTARLWQRLDVPERAASALGEALELPGLADHERSALAVDRARLRRVAGDEAGAAAELRRAAAFLPDGDAVGFELLCSAARLDPAAAPADLAALAARATDALRARQLAGVHAARADEAARAAARRAAARLPGSPLALPAVELAEDLAAAQDVAGALQLYQIELARRRLPAAGDLAGARTALVRAVLAETPAGARLLAESARQAQDAVSLGSWQVRGPVPLGDWTPHEKPAFDPGQPPAGDVWKPVRSELWQAGVLDLGHFGGGDGVVWYLATTLTSERDRTVSASFGADDALTVWLNGAQLHTDRTQRGIVPDSIVLDLPLRTGVNVLLCSVQNGGGATAFQCRIRREPWPASDLAAVLTGADDRAAALQTLVELSGALLAADRVDEAWALARTAIACWPERIDQVRDLAARALTQPQWRATPAMLRELASWFDAHLADRRWDDGAGRALLGEVLPERMLEAGLVEEAMTRLQHDARTALEPLVVAEAWLRQADIWLAMGLPRRAASALEAARDAAPGEDAVDSAADRRRGVLRQRKGDRVTIAAPFELTSLLRTAERTMASDPARAARDLQQVIEGAGDQPVQLADGRLRGAGVFAADRLRAGGRPLVEAWSGANADRAAAALARADQADPQALSRISGRWPLAAAAGEALRREAALWSARGAWQLAAGTALRCLAEHGADDHLLLLRAAHAAARAGDAAALDGLLARLARTGRPLPWDGRSLPPEQLAGALRGLLPQPVAVEPGPAALLVRLPAYALAMRPETVADARPPVPAAALCDDLLVVATPGELAAIAADGSLRWSLTAPATAGVRTPPVASAGEAALAVDGGVVAAGLHRDGSRRLVAVEAASGRLLWSSAGLAELAGASLASVPTISAGRIWAWFIDSSRGFVACIDARDGTVLWRSTLGTGVVRQPLMNAGDVFAAGNAPAPALHGRELFVATDAGQIGAFDAVDGRLLWLHAYPRTAIDVHEATTALRRLMARGRGAVLVDGARVYVAPRDGLGILALDRAGGAQAWAAELADVHELCALTPAGLVALGPAVTLHDPATGALRLRWSPSTGELPGRPAVVGDGLWIPLQQGPLHLSLADGGIRQGPAWGDLDLEGMAPGALQIGAGRMLALADGMVALTGTGAGKAVTSAFLPRIEPAIQDQAPIGEAAPTALAPRWDLPIGRIEALHRPADARGGESYACAAGVLHRIDAATGRIAWSVPAQCSPRGLDSDGGALLVRSDGRIAILDRETGRLRHAEPISRDPFALRSRTWDAWRVQARLAGGMLVRWNSGESWFSLRSAEDGRSLLDGRCEGGVWGVNPVGELVQILVARGDQLLLEQRRISDGSRLDDVPLGLPGDEASILRLLDGRLVIGNRNGGRLYDPSSGSMTSFDPGMQWINAAWRDGDVLTLAGVQEGSHRCTFLDQAGAVLGRDEYSRWGDWAERLPLAPRWINGLRVQTGSRGGRTGYQISRRDGAEQTWLPVREDWRRNQYGLIPLAGKAIAFASDKDGLLRLQLVDPAAGRIDVDSAVALTMVGQIVPVEAAGGVLVPATRGLVSIVPVAAPARPLPGRALADTPAAVWRLAKAPDLDGRLDEWADQAGLEQDGGDGLSARLAWRDDAMLMALRLPRPPAQTGSTLVAIERMRGEFDWEAPPLLISLAWLGGAVRTQVLSSPSADDASRPPIQARAASDGSTLTWEVAVPWSWLYPAGERPGRDHWLRWGALATQAGGEPSGLELGLGLGQGLDKSALIRLHLVEAKPDPDAPPPRNRRR